MPDPSELSRRERQIMDAVFALGEATVNQVVETIPSPPTAMAVRRMMHILEEKGHLRRRESGREVIYVPRQAKGKAGRHAFEQVLQTFFGGSLEEALAAHLHSRKDHVSVDERAGLVSRPRDDLPSTPSPVPCKMPCLNVDFGPLLRRIVNSSDLRIGFIGAGQMATALARGFVQAKVISPDRIVACDISGDAGVKFASQTGGSILKGASAVLNQSTLLFLAVKPQHIAAVLAELKPAVTSEHLIVSIAAGISLAKLSAGLGQFSRLIRVMPNTPALVGAGASAFARGATATAEDGQLVEGLLSTVGLALEVPEKLLDAVTGLSGSGPAYVYQFIEGLSDGGVRMGLPRDVATRLAAQTVLGAAQMVLSTGQHTGSLKDAVTSPGGTTIAGLHALEQGGMRGILMNAVQAATERSQQLGEA